MNICNPRRETVAHPTQPFCPFLPVVKVRGVGLWELVSASPSLTSFSSSHSANRPLVMLSSQGIR